MEIVGSKENQYFELDQYKCAKTDKKWTIEAKHKV